MSMEPPPPPPQKRRRSSRDVSAASDGCVHFTSAAAASARRLRAKAAASASDRQQRDIERLEGYASSVTERGDSDDGVRADVYECLSCSFSGVRERLSSSADDCTGAESSSFMAHAILHDHPLGLLVRKQQLYCAYCRDFIYPSALLKSRASLGLETNIDAGQTQKRSPSASAFWLQKKKLMLPPATPRRPSRRGFVNMGNTCYMNVVLQAFVHNVLLQYYFLVAKGHGTTICKQTRKQRTSETSLAREASSAPPLPVCLGCDLGEFMATLSPATTASGAPGANRPSLATSSSSSPFVPHKIMEALWSFAPAFIGSQQHDAHEFFLAFLNGLHAHTHPRVFTADGDAMSPRFTLKGKSLCDCVVHQHFAGVLVSQVECALCDQVSSTFDPFLDISLSLDSLVVDAKANSSSSSREEEAPERSPGLSLESLLTKFTAEEHLRGINRVYCRRCSTYANMCKRLRFHRLPNVLVVHVKRLDFHKQQKLSDFVQFPLRQLSLEAFRANSSSSSAPEDDLVTPRAAGAGDEADGCVEEPDASLYDLVAVINHHGDSVQGGHYTAFIQSGGGLSDYDADGSDLGSNWFLFDDTHVTPATEAQVLRSQAYMLYYVRRRPQILM